MTAKLAKMVERQFFGKIKEYIHLFSTCVYTIYIYVPC